MEYMTVKDAAVKWNISERYVQRYCTEGRIEGAIKFGGTWAIPPDAGKPEDLRRKQKSEENKENKESKENKDNKDNEKAPEKTEEVLKNASSDDLKVVMPLLNTPYAPGYAMEAIENIEDTDMRNIALAEYYYFSGHSAKASDIVEEYLTHKDLALRLSACWLYAYANLALDRISRARQALNQIRVSVAEVDGKMPPVYRAYANCVSMGASVLLHLPVSEDPGTVRKSIALLPPGLKLFSLYMQAHQTYLDGKYGACIGIAETALVLEEKLYPIASVYLHLVCTMGYINLRQSEQAKEHLLEAWKIAQPDDMIEAFGEHHGLLGGMLEAVIRKDYPSDFKRIIDITYSFSAGWRKIHNPDTGHNVADDLTTTEFTIAMLAARGWSNKEISAHLDISVNTVKMHVSSVLQQLGVPQRKDLAQFMLK